MAVLTAAAVLTLASAYGDWDPHVATWLVFDAGTGHGESSGRADVISPDGKYVGLMQIDWRLHGYTVEQLQDPAFNIEVAHRLWLQRGWQPWPSAVKYPGRSQVAAVTPDGWLTWAERMPGRPRTNTLGEPMPGFNAGINGVHGIVFHSAEGYAETLLSKTSQWGYYSAQYPWHLSNLLDGRLIQHYPFTARCWHGSAFNDNYVGMENEGYTPKGQTFGPLLNAGQIANARRVIASLSEWKGWTPRRPTSPSDKTASLYEHTEVVRFGGTGTQCPSKRIPWEAILQPAQENEMANLNADGSQRIVSEGNFIVTYNGNVAVQRVGSTDGRFPGRMSKNFGGKWLWFRTLDANAQLVAPYWSEDEGD